MSLIGSNKALLAATSGAVTPVEDTGFTLSFSNVSYTDINSASGYVSAVGYGIYLKPDGTAFFWVDSDKRVHSFPMSTAFQPETAGTEVQSGLIQCNGATADVVYGLAFNDTGTKVYLFASRNASDYATATALIQEHALSTAWDVTSINTTATSTYDVKSNHYITLAQSINVVNSGTELRFLVPPALSGEWSNISGLNPGSPNYRIFAKLDLSTAYDLSTATLDTNSARTSNNFQLSSTGALYSFDFAGSDSAIGAVASGRWYNISFATQDDFSTASVSDNVYDNAVSTATTTLRFGNSGSDVYVSRYSAGEVRRFSLSTAYDLSTASLVSDFNPSEMTTVADVYFTPDGLTMFLISEATDNVHKYTLSTAWDPTSATQTQTLATGTSYPRTLDFKTDGTKMYVGDRIFDTIDEWTLATPWDLSTATFVQDKDFTTNSALRIVQSIDMVSFRFNSTGTKLYFLGAGDVGLCRYDLSTAWDISTATMSQFPVEYVLVSDAIQTSGNASVYWATANWPLTTRPYGTMRGFINATNWQLGSATGTSYKDHKPAIETLGEAVYADNGTKIIGVDASYRKVYVQQMTSNYNGATYGVTQTNQFQIPPSGTTSYQQSLTLSPDGTRFWFLDTTNTADQIYQVNMSTAYDLSTASYTPGDIFSYNYIYSFVFDGTGSNVYMATSGQRFYKFALSTPYDITTTAASPSSTINWGTSGSNIYSGINTYSMQFHDGGRILLLGDGFCTVYTFNLSTPYDLSTASAGPIQNMVTFGLPNGRTNMATFNLTGTRLIVKDFTYRVWLFDCSTPWDPTTAVYSSQSQFIYSAMNNQYYQNIAYSADGRKVLGQSSYSTPEDFFQMFDCADPT